MRVKIFKGSEEEIEGIINQWLDVHTIRIIYIKQSVYPYISMKTGLGMGYVIVSIFYK